MSNNKIIDPYFYDTVHDVRYRNLEDLIFTRILEKLTEFPGTVPPETDFDKQWAFLHKVCTKRDLYTLQYERYKNRSALELDYVYADLKATVDTIFVSALDDRARYD